LHPILKARKERKIREIFKEVVNKREISREKYQDFKKK